MLKIPPSARVSSEDVKSAGCERLFPEIKVRNLTTTSWPYILRHKKYKLPQIDGNWRENGARTEKSVLAVEHKRVAPSSSLEAYII